jgi:hypothetical protein
MGDFGKEVGQVFRGIREGVEKAPVRDNNAKQAGSMDRSVKEQVLSDIDGLIKKHEGQ